MNPRNDLKFQNIYDTFHDKIRRYLARLVGEAESEDLTHEVFIKVSGALDDFRRDSQLSTWIYRIATNTALDRLRSQDYKRSVEERLSIDEIQMPVEDINVWTGGKIPPPDQQLIRKEMNACIRSFIDSLPADYRTVIVLSEFEDLKNREIAEVLNISIETVKIRLYRAKTKLKEVLNCHCSFYRDTSNILLCDLKFPPK